MQLEDFPVQDKCRDCMDRRDVEEIARGPSEITRYYEVIVTSGLSLALCYNQYIVPPSCSGHIHPTVLVYNVRVPKHDLLYTTHVCTFYHVAVGRKHENCSKSSITTSFYAGT
jgi:hypothetical protein